MAAGRSVNKSLCHKNGEFLYGSLRVSDTLLLCQTVAALNVTPPGQWRITQVPG